MRVMRELASAFGHATRSAHHARRITQCHRQDLRLESAPLARVAELRAHEALEPVPGELALALLIEPLEVGDDALEGAHDFARLAGAPEAELDFGLTRAPQQHALEILRKRLIRRFHALLIMTRDAAQQALVIDDHPLAAPPPRQNRPLLKGLLRIRHHQALVEDQLLAQPMANRACA